MAGGATLKLSLILVGFVSCVSLPAQALDRWAALSLIESGDNDKATGPSGEVSRYQIQRALWDRYAPTNADWTRPEDALTVAKAIMQDRCATFEKSHQRSPTDFEFYVLWNAPKQVDKPSKAVSRRAQRFCNLVEANPPEDPKNGESAGSRPSALASAPRRPT
jgi:hypothetical protein